MGSNLADEHEAIDIRGTVTIVIIIGVIILAVWIAVFLLFLSRN